MLDGLSEFQKESLYKGFCSVIDIDIVEKQTQFFYLLKPVGKLQAGLVSSRCWNKISFILYCFFITYTTKITKMKASIWRIMNILVTYTLHILRSTTSFILSTNMETSYKNTEMLRIWTFQTQRMAIEYQSYASKYSEAIYISWQLHYTFCLYL